MAIGQMMVMLKSGKVVFGEGWASTLVFWILMVRPKRSYVFLKLLTDCCISSDVCAGVAWSSAYRYSSVTLVSLWEWSLDRLKSGSHTSFRWRTNQLILAKVFLAVKVSWWCSSNGTNRLIMTGSVFPAEWEGHQFSFFCTAMCSRGSISSSWSKLSQKEKQWQWNVWLQKQAIFLPLFTLPVSPSGKQ